MNQDYAATQHWLQIMLSATPDNADDLSDLLSEAGAIAVTLADEGDEPIYEPPPGDEKLWSRTRVIGLFEMDTRVDDVLHHLKTALQTDQLPPCVVKHFANEDWERVWIDQFKPMKFGNRLWVCPSAHTPPEPKAVNLILDPGLAFGTGTHQTTALCLEVMDGMTLTGQTVIDYGCGSGILAIAAACLGAEHVWAIDIDDQALLATSENASRNRVDDKITADFPDVLPDAMQVDALVANILANPLIALAERFSQLVRPGGRLVLSGILYVQAEQICDAYDPWFDIDKMEARDGWICIHATRKTK